MQAVLEGQRGGVTWIHCQDGKIGSWLNTTRALMGHARVTRIVRVSAAMRRTKTTANLTLIVPIARMRSALSVRGRGISKTETRSAQTAHLEGCHFDVDNGQMFCRIINQMKKGVGYAKTSDRAPAPDTSSLLLL